ncbi:MAG: LysM peptidoglycan-binding domain-containing protein [Anaerolineae bacterium]|nr:LysM peptidoglycan-binding domain-containing protein [Anaerolineae bacterium]
MRKTPSSITLSFILLLVLLGANLTTAQALRNPDQAQPNQAETTETIYTVQRGDNLNRIAARFGTSVGAILNTNRIANANLIYVGQRLVIPVPAPPSAEISAPAVTTPTPAMATGITVFTLGQDPTLVIEQVERLSLSWVKLDVLWRELEPSAGIYNFDELDAVVTALDQANLNVLFTVWSAPSWARSTAEESGPPDDFSAYAGFMRTLAERYQGRVQAYEIWNEPNLRREWNSELHPISAASYAELLHLAYEAVKAGDANALVISAGLAPTGFNDGVNAIDDRLYLRDLYASGLATISDAIGAHPEGWANPPDAHCCDQPEGVETHYDSRTFFFLDTLADYRQIMIDHGDQAAPIWVTRFGWGSSADTSAPSAINIFYSYTDLTEQAAYTPRALTLGAELGYIGAMFIDNLNGCVALPDDAEACYTSLIGPNGQVRPVFDALVDRAQPGG